MTTSARSRAASLLLLCGIGASATIAHAQDPDIDPDTDPDTDPAAADLALLQGWRGSASVGATSSTGAAESSNVNATLKLAKSYDRWEHLVFATVFKGSSTLVVEDVDEQGLPTRRIVKGDNSDRIALGYQPKYFFRDNTYAFGLLDWESDEPANIDSSFRQVIGVGHRFYANDTGFLSGEIGIGNKNTDQVSGPDLNGAIGYLGLNYLYRLSDVLTFDGDVRADFGSDNTFVEIGLGLTAKLSDRLGAKVAHFSRSNSDLDNGDNPLDSGSSSVTTFSLVFDI